jgi:hypothetical protein
VELARRDVLAFRARTQQLGRATGSVADTAVLDPGLQDTGTDGAAWALALRGLPDPRPTSSCRRRRCGAPRTSTGGPTRHRRGHGPFSGDAARMREVVDRPTVEGEHSGRLTAVLDEPDLRARLPCGAIHAYEQPFGLAALRAGLELEPRASPPVLRAIPGFVPE